MKTNFYFFYNEDSKLTTGVNMYDIQAIVCFPKESHTRIEMTLSHQSSTCSVFIPNDEVEILTKRLEELQTPTDGVGAHF